MNGEQSKAALRLLRRASTFTEDSPNQGNDNISHDHDENGHYGYEHDEEVVEFANQKDDREKPWGKVVGATFLVNLVSLVGILSLFCMMNKAAIFSNTYWVDVSVSSSAAGALLAAACLIILPESSVMLLEAHTESASASGHEDDEDDKAEVSWKFGVSILFGILLPMIVGAFFPRPQDHKCDEKCESNVGPTCQYPRKIGYSSCNRNLLTMIVVHHY